MSEDEVVRQRNRFSGHEFEQTLGDSEGQGSLVCCSPWGRRVRYDLATEQLAPEAPGDLCALFPASPVSPGSVS